MAKLIKNPISITFILIGGGLIIYSVLDTLYSIFISTGRVSDGVQSGQTVLTAIQLVFFPYTYNFAPKLGQSQENFIIVTLVVMQISLIALVFAVSRVRSRSAKLITSIVGILVVISYFSFTFLAGLLTAIH